MRNQNQNQQQNGNVQGQSRSSTLTPAISRLGMRQNEQNPNREPLANATDPGNARRSSRKRTRQQYAEEQSVRVLIRIEIECVVMF